MPSTFSGLETALRALHAQQRALETVDHNIANANTEGYSRQRAIMAATEPYTVPALNREDSVAQLGTGVEVTEIHRYTSDYLNAQMRAELPRGQRWETIESAYKQIEVIFNEPSDSGISAALGRFWQSWSDATGMPDDLGARTAVTEAASNLAFSIRDADSRLRDIQSDMDLQVRQNVARINDIAVQIAALNDPISKVQAFGDQPNDLRDKRDMLLDELSKIVDINYYENSDGTMTVDIGGHALVMGNDYGQLLVQPDPTNSMRSKVVWADGQTPLVVHGVPLAGPMSAANGELVGGTLGGAIYTRDVVVNDQLAKLDNIASSLIDAVNQLHAGGFGLPDDSAGSPATPRPGSALAGTPTLTTPPVSGVVVDNSLYPAALGIGAGHYSVQVSDASGTWRFRLLDSQGQAVQINAVAGGGMTDDWQALPSGTFDTGRGFAIQFSGTPTASGEVASFDYNNFFKGSSAHDIDVSDWVRNNRENVAMAASGDAAGDGSVALAISRLRTKPLLNGFPIDGYYNSVVTDLGLASKQASAMVTNSQNLVEHLQTRKDEVSAVNLDEETVSLIQYQKAYQGAARVMTAIDDMLDRLINNTGRVGL